MRKENTNPRVRCMTLSCDGGRTPTTLITTITIYGFWTRGLTLRPMSPLTSLSVNRKETGQISPSTTGASHRSEEHTSELQSLMRISYAVFCLKKKKKYQHVQT